MSFGFEASAKGGKTDTDIGQIKWDIVERLMGLDEEYNRINRYGPFGGWEYDPETKSQRFVATDPGMQAGMERMSRRLGGEGFTPYEPPGQASAITDALMSSRMERMGLLNEETRPNLAQQNYGTRFGDRQGGAWGEAVGHPAWNTPPPSQGGNAPPQQQPPQQGGPRPPTGGGPAPSRPIPPRNPYYTYER